MPDPFEYLKAVLAAIVSSTAILLAFRVRSWKRGRLMPETANVVAVTCGALAGYFALNFSWPWPPASALDRFLSIVLPAVVIIELFAAITNDVSPTDATVSPAHKPLRIGRSVRVAFRIARCSLCCCIGRILMHGSIYLDNSSSRPDDEWLIENMSGIFLFSTLPLMAMWTTLTKLAAHADAGSIVLSLSLSILSAGCTTMMAGYIKGGAAGIPIATVLMVSAFAPHFLLSKRSQGHQHISRSTLGTAAVGIGLVSLFSLLWIGRFFGQLTSTDVLVMFLVPSLCWISELPLIRDKSATAKFMVRVVAVIVPLATLLVNAKREFDEKMGPLL